MVCLYSPNELIFMDYERKYFVGTAKTSYWNLYGCKTKDMICYDKIWEI